MEKVARKFSSFQEAEDADRDFYRSLTAAQRIQMMLELLELSWLAKDGSPPRLEGVYRVAEFPPR